MLALEVLVCAAILNSREGALPEALRGQSAQAHSALTQSTDAHSGQTQSVFSQRLAEADRIDDPVQRAILRAGIFFEARDFGAVLHEAQLGLQVNPSSLELLWRASAAELWLQDGRRALSWIEQLRAAADTQALEPDVREGWLTAAQNFEKDAIQLRDLQAEGDSALLRSQISVSVIAAAAALAILGLIRPGRVNSS